MIDSINFIVRNVENIEFQRFKENHIRYKRFENNINNFGSVGYSFEYKGVEFKYYKSFKIILVIANAHKVLEKRDILLSDLSKYKERLKEIVKTALGTEAIKLELNRIDYCVDLKLDEKMKIYLELLKFHRPKYKYMRMEKFYSTSKYLKTKNGKNNINIYNRYSCTEDEEDKGILRIEVQNKKKKIKSEFDKYGIDKDIDNYWTKEAMGEYYFDFLKNYLYIGDYLKKQIAYEKINKSDNKPKQISNLKKFLRDVEQGTMYDIFNCKEYGNTKINNYIKKLENLNINPIPISDIYFYDELPSLYTLAKKTAEEKYFK